MKWSLLLLLFPLSSYSQDPIKLDGKIDPVEWKSADSFALDKGGTLRLKKDQSFLYIGLTGNDEGWSHVYLQKKDTIFVLHASAALGTAIYVNDGVRWNRVQTFQWGFKAMVYNDGTKKVMDDFLKANRWVANNNNIGTGKTLEYKIDLSAFNGIEKIAFVFAADANEPHFFPKGLKDATISTDLVYGNPPDMLRFDPGSWWQLH